MKKDDFYNLVFKNYNIPLIIYDKDGSIVDANEAALALYGYKHEEIVKLAFSDIVHPEYIEVALKYADITKKKKQFQGKIIERKKDGTPIDAMIHLGYLLHKNKSFFLAVVEDISKIQKIKGMLQEVENKYQAVFETLHEGVIICDLNGTIREVNPAFAKMHGYEQKELIGQSSEILVSERSKLLYKTFLKTIQEGRTFETEAMDIKKDGTPFDIEVEAMPIDINGEKLSLLTMRDLTPLKVSQKELEASKDFLNRIMQNVSDAIYALDLKGRFIMVNPKVLEITGYSEQAIIGSPYAILIQHDELQKVNEAFQRVIKKGEKIRNFKITLLRKNGSTRNISFNISPIYKEGKVAFVAGTAIDLEEKGCLL